MTVLKGSAINSGSGSGPVSGPATSTLNAVAKWGDTTGDTLKNSSVVIDDSNNVSGIVNLTQTGNHVFSSTAQRVSADMSNATRANRLAFQTSTTNGNTRLGLLPNGTSTISGIDCYAGTDPDNAAFLQVHVDGGSSHVGLNSSKTGTGVTKDLVFQIDSVTKSKINATNGAFEAVSTAINEAAYATVASAATCDIGAAASNNVAISGTTTITSFGTANAGVTRRCRATGAFLITYNATSLITKNGKNIATKADDCFTMTSLGSGNWIMTQFDPADGRSLANSINNQTGTTYTLALTDIGNDVTLSNASAITVTIPTAVTFPIGTTITLRNIGAGTASLVKAAGSADIVIGNTTLITGAVVTLKVLSANTWQIFAATAVVNMTAVNSVTLSLATSRTEYLWFVQANCTLLGITTRCSALIIAGTFKLQLNGVDITGLTGIVPATGSTTFTYPSSAVSLVTGDVVTVVADGTLNAVTNMTISPIFTVTY